MICYKPNLSTLLAVVCLLLILTLVACLRESPAQSSNPSLQITLLAAPDGMQSDYQIVQVVDQAGQPVTDATVRLEGKMNHGAMAPIVGDAVIDEADGTVDGHYQAPISLKMLGDWIMTVSVKTKDGATVTQDIPVQVSDQGITINN
ncbi:MAG: FixH family protein [Caldilineaceae bacterium]